jgi:hypothetical protein
MIECWNRGNMSTNLFHWFLDRIRDSGVFDLVTLWLPNDFIVKTTNLPVWKRDLDALFANVEKVLKRDLLMAEKHADNGKYDKVKKVLTHTIRMTMMATQIVQNGKVTEWNCANELFETLTFSYHLKSWDGFVEEVLPIQQQELANLKTALGLPS